MHSTGSRAEPDGGTTDYTLVALGIIEADGETVNGVIGRVTDEELVELDRRERHYDRVDVTQRVSVRGADHVDGRIVVYVPRAEAIAHYESARDRGVAAIELRYWELVDAAFASLGADAHVRYHATTPAPDVPILELVREWPTAGQPAEIERTFGCRVE
jgi:Gamma-glutamyl cyclotransferase, AIG2-like